MSNQYKSHNGSSICQVDSNFSTGSAATSKTNETVKIKLNLNSYEIIILDKPINYNYWYDTFLELLDYEELSKHLLKQGSIGAPELQNENGTAGADLAKNKQVKLAIFISTTPNYRKYIKREHTASEAWTALKEFFSKQTAVDQIQIKSELTELTLDHCKNMDELTITNGRRA